MFPKEVELRQTFIAQRLLELMSQSERFEPNTVGMITKNIFYVRWLEIFMGLDAVENAVNGPSKKEMEKLIEKRTDDALRAGAILCVAITLYMTWPDECSINNAIYLLADAGDYLSAIGGEKLVSLSCSDRKLRSVWSDYNLVSHFWAPALMRRIRVDISGFGSVVKSMNADFWHYMSLAESLRKWGESYYTKHGEKTPLLKPEETWKLPNCYYGKDNTFDDQNE